MSKKPKFSYDEHMEQMRERIRQKKDKKENSPLKTLRESTRRPMR